MGYSPGDMKNATAAQARKALDQVRNLAPMFRIRCGESLDHMATCDDFQVQFDACSDLADTGCRRAQLIISLLVDAAVDRREDLSFLNL